MRIGITERGDAGINLAWTNKLNTVDGAILITKHITPEFSMAVQEASTPIIVHCTCTGWGASGFEPNVPTFKEQLDALAELTKKYSFPKEKCVIRIDPIFPTERGLNRVDSLLGYAKEIDLLPMRVRISIYDEYPHCRTRLADRGIRPLYGGSFYAPPDMMRYAAKRLSDFSDKYSVVFETCAEPTLVKYTAHSGVFKATGCLSLDDIELMGLDTEAATKNINGQNRHGCLCLACKKELLNERRPCEHKCVYCFWKD